MGVGLFEVEVKNRVVKRFGSKIFGMQGNWYPESLYFLAESEKEAEELAREQLKKRRVLGVSRRRRKRSNMRREIEIINIRRLA